MKKIIKEKKKNGSGGKLLEGALVGAVLGIAAGMILTSEAGKKMGTDIKKLSVDFYRYMAPQVKKLKKLGESEYNALVEQTVKKYAKAKKLSLAEEKILAKEAKRSWGHIKSQLK
jgi:gas vesicle protein